MEMATNHGPILALDIGKAFTRAFLFNLVHDRYCLLGTGKSNTTLGIYGQNICLGARMAIEELQANTGRILINSHKELIQPGSPEGTGVNQCVLTLSAGPPIKIFLIGAVKEPSLSEIQKLVRSVTLCQLSIYEVDEDSQPERILDDILRHRPDLIIVSVGLKGSGSKLVSQFIEPVRLAFLQLPSIYRPEILYLVNQDYQSLVGSSFNHSKQFHCAPYLFPGVEPQSTESVRSVLAAIVLTIRTRQLSGLSELIGWSHENVLSGSVAFGRLIHLISQAHALKKGVLGIDYGVSGVSVAESSDGSLTLGISDPCCVPGIEDRFNNPELMKQVIDWLADPDISEEVVLEYIYNKSIYPTSISLSRQEVNVQEAIARLEIGTAVYKIMGKNSPEVSPSKESVLVLAEPILVSGGFLSARSHPGRNCLLLLDSLQPRGITTFILDPQHVAVPLGAIAQLDPEAALQVADSDVFDHLATVISPVGNAPPGTPILRIFMTLEDGSVKTMDIKQGELDVMPLPPGTRAQLQLQPFHRFDIGMGGTGRGGTLRVVGSILGIVVDGRGRPLKLSDNMSRRKELIRKWLWMLGG